jgi:hypothetical protein
MLPALHSCLVFPAMGPMVIGLLHDPIPGNGSFHGKSNSRRAPESGDPSINYPRSLEVGDQ